MNTRFTVSHTYDNSNIFAKIIRKEAGANIVYEDNKVIAFYDIKPIATTHILIVPKGEYIDYCDFITRAPSMDVYHYFSVINELVRCYKLHKSGFKLVTNNGANAGQEVFHFHTHIISNQSIQPN